MEGGPDEAASKKKEAKKKPGEKKGAKLVTGSAVVAGVRETVQWAPPKTLTGAVQIQHGEVKHAAREVDIYGTSVFGSDQEKTQGTFTSYFGLRYALIAFHGVANEHSAQHSKMTDADYDTLLKVLWYGVRSAANTRTKTRPGSATDPEYRLQARGGVPVWPAQRLCENDTPSLEA